MSPPVMQRIGTNIAISIALVIGMFILFRKVGTTMSIFPIIRNALVTHTDTIMGISNLIEMIAGITMIMSGIMMRVIAKNAIRINVVTIITATDLIIIPARKNRTRATEKTETESDWQSISASKKC